MLQCFNASADCLGITCMVTHLIVYTVVSIHSDRGWHKAVKRMDTVAWVLVVGGLLAGCNAMEVACRVTPDDDQTTYSIDITLGECYEYSFVNATNYVLANHAEPSCEPVIRSNMSTLVTSRCIENIICQLSCISQGEIHTITSNCSIACSGKLKGGKGETGSLPHTSFTWIAVVVPVLLVLGVLALLFFKCRQKISCLHRCMYTGVNTDRPAADVEASNQ